ANFNPAATTQDRRARFDTPVPPDRPPPLAPNPRRQIAGAAQDSADDAVRRRRAQEYAEALRQQAAEARERRDRDRAWLRGDPHSSPMQPAGGNSSSA
ncbi:hypothetical protein HK405_010891, partial [Cladochytrium tenue]